MLGLRTSGVLSHPWLDSFHHSLDTRYIRKLGPENWNGGSSRKSEGLGNVQNLLFFLISALGQSLL